jgi:Raf kinase inhibitor-like YbhB/YbcL family protein
MKMRKLAWGVVAMGIGLASTAGAREGTISVSSPAFNNGGMVPAEYTCDGRGVAPTITWTAVPAETKSIAIIVDDPDAPGATFDHLILFNLPPTQRSLTTDMTRSLTPTSDLISGRNSSGSLGYTAICPPTGRHHYRFHVLALDAMLPLRAGASGKEVQEAAKTHVLARGELVGLYQKR